MIWSDNDVYNDFTLGVVEGVVLPPVVLRLAHEVYREYQRQLWDPEYDKHVGKHCDEFHFHKYGDVGVLFIDMRGNRSVSKHLLVILGFDLMFELHRRIDTNGDTFPERPLVSEQQWKFIEKSLNTPDLQALLVLSEIPFVGDRYGTLSLVYQSLLVLTVNCQSRRGQKEGIGPAHRVHCGPLAVQQRRARQIVDSFVRLEGRQ
jgi:hypothetical protein